jgi:hypothetical protein
MTLDLIISAAGSLALAATVLAGLGWAIINGRPASIRPASRSTGVRRPAAIAVPATPVA